MISDLSTPLASPNNNNATTTRRHGGVAFKGLLALTGWLVAFVLYSEQQQPALLGSSGEDVQIKTRAVYGNASIEQVEKLLKKQHKETLEHLGNLIQENQQVPADLQVNVSNLNKQEMSDLLDAKLNLKQQHQETMKELGNIQEQIQQLQVQFVPEQKETSSVGPQSKPSVVDVTDNVPAAAQENTTLAMDLTPPASVEKTPPALKNTPPSVDNPPAVPIDASTPPNIAPPAPATADPLVQRALINNPPIPPTAGTLTQTSNITPFRLIRPTLDKSRTDGEDYDIVHHYFWGQENGIVMELGALDGQLMSVSRAFIDLNWHRLLVEANPRRAKKGPTNSPDATFVHAAICNPEQTGTVHYLRDLNKKATGATNGIAEFMSTGFFKQFHRQVFQETDQGTNFAKVSDWALWSKEKGRQSAVDEVPCLGLNSVFNHLDIQKINFFMLDVEGAELNILQSLDFTTIQFDVLIVETEPNSPKYRPEGYAQKVIDFMVQEKGYVFDKNVGRNSWFHHPNFVPFKDPAFKR